VQRCVRHRERNVLDRLPERDRPAVKQRLRDALALEDYDRALDEVKLFGAELERSHPGAAASLREGLAETLTFTRLGVTGSLRRTLASTNPCESMIECVRRTRQSGDMALRWTAAGMLEAERQFRRIIGSRSPSSPSRSSVTSPARPLRPRPRRPARCRGGHRWFLSLRQTREEVVEAGEKHFGQPGPRLSWVGNAV
jgi:hypothetical protein